MTPKHTPGPLVARRNVGVALGSDQPQPYIVEGPQGWTALVGTEADAKLYAAAPDLLAEALSIRRKFDRDDTPINREVRPSGAGVWVFITRKSAGRTRAAIREAEGPGPDLGAMRRAVARHATPDQVEGEGP